MYSQLNPKEAGYTVDNAMEQVAGGADVPLHNRRAAVNEYLHLLPVLRAYDSFMAALKHYTCTNPTAC